jgi:hypothetical protein
MSGSSQISTTTVKRISFELVKGLLISRGFLDIDRPIPGLSRKISYHVLRKAVDKRYLDPPARIFHINLGIGVGRGGTKYGSWDYVGFLFKRRYLVLDERLFRSEVSSEIEFLFRKKNPVPSRELSTSFTRAMHDNGLHWSGEMPCRSQ